MSEPLLAIRKSRVGNALIVALSGEIDMASAPELDQALELVDRGADPVVVDLSDVGFLDSSALNVLVRCHRRMHERRIRFCVVSPDDHPLRRVFEITHLAEPLNVVSSVDAALA